MNSWMEWIREIAYERIDQIERHLNTCPEAFPEFAAAAGKLDAAMDETERRRGIQSAYNETHGIVPKTIIKGVREVLEISKTAESDTIRGRKKRKLSEQERAAEIAKLEKEMKEAAKLLEFEYAAVLRDRIVELKGEK